MGRAPAAETSGGMGVGPGDIRRYLFIMGSGNFLSACREQPAAYSRHSRPVWLHNGAGNLQSVAFSLDLRCLVLPGLDDLDWVVDEQAALLIVDQVLSEEDVLPGSAEAGQRTQGLLALGCGSLIHGRY